jgi:hypothetical protein
MGERSNPEVAAARISEWITNLLAEIQEYCWDFSVTSDLLELRNINTVAGRSVAAACITTLIARNPARLGGRGTPSPDGRNSRTAVWSAGVFVGPPAAATGRRDASKSSTCVLVAKLLRLACSTVALRKARTAAR